MVRAFILTAGLAASGAFLFVSDKSPAASNAVPVQSIITVEARRTHGTEVPALSPGDVTAYEHRERLAVTELVALQGENADLQLFVLIDDSSDSSLGSSFGELRSFIDAQPARTAIGLGYMRNGMVELRQDLTADHSRAAQALRVPLSSAGASPYLALSDLIKRWPGGAKSRRAVVMVTSGVDPLGGPGLVDPYLDSAIEDAQRNEVIVYGIYMPAAGHSGHSFFRINWGQSHLAQLAEETGGEAYMLGFEPPISFAPYLDDIAAHLMHQYRVTFLMTPERKGGFRDVRFATEVPNAELVAASKVYVAASK